MALRPPRFRGHEAARQREAESRATITMTDRGVIGEASIRTAKVTSLMGLLGGLLGASDIYESLFVASERNLGLGRGAEFNDD